MVSRIAELHQPATRGLDDLGPDSGFRLARREVRRELATWKRSLATDTVNSAMPLSLLVGSLGELGILTALVYAAVMDLELIEDGKVTDDRGGQKGFHFVD